MKSPVPLSPHQHINLNVRGLGMSATLAINERSKRLQAEGREVFRLGLGQSPFPVPEHLRAALAQNAHQKDYLPVQGLPDLRQAFADYLSRTQGLELGADDVLVGPGTKELMFLVQLVYYGDLVIPAPSWVSYAPQAQIVGRPLRWLATRAETGLGVEPDVLEELCVQDPTRPRLLILNYPGNPTGMCYQPEQLEAIAEVARRYQVLVLSDEIYSGTRFDGEHVSIARFYPEGTIVSDGLSKWAGAGGWRLGAFAFPPSLAFLGKAMATAASETYTSTSAPIQHAAVTGFATSPAMDVYLDQCRRVLAALIGHGHRQMEAAGAACAAPKGGFYLFPNFDDVKERLSERGLESSDALCARLLEETGVAALPGSCFGRPAGELSLRLALVDFDGAAALEAAAKTEGPLGEDFLERHCPRMVRAVGSLRRWIEEGPRPSPSRGP